MARTAGRRTCETLASDPGQADQTGSAGGARKPGPGRQIVSQDNASASAESKVRPGPRLRPYARTTTKPRKQGRKHYPHSPCRIFTPRLPTEPSGGTHADYLFGLVGAVTVVMAGGRFEVDFEQA